MKDITASCCEQRMLVLCCPGPALPNLPLETASLTRSVVMRPTSRAPPCSQGLRWGQAGNLMQSQAGTHTVESAVAPIRERTLS